MTTDLSPFTHDLHDISARVPRWIMSDGRGRFAKEISPFQENLGHQLFCQGTNWLKLLPSGLEIGAVEWQPTEEVQVKMEHVRNPIGGIVLLEGKATLRSEGLRGDVHLSTAETTFFQTAVPAATLNVSPKGPLRGIYYKMTTEFVQRAGSELISQLPPPIQTYLQQSEPQPYQTSTALSTQIESIARQILAVPYSGVLEQLYLEAKTLELLTLHLAAMQPLPSLPPAGLTNYDVECLHHAKKLLEDGFQSPPTLIELAHRVGINQNKLKQGFRTLFKITPFAYVRRLRLRHARELLDSSDLSVQEIAGTVGYRHATNFTAAFRAEFGISPRSHRCK